METIKPNQNIIKVGTIINTLKSNNMMMNMTIAKYILMDSIKIVDHTIINRSILVNNKINPTAIKIHTLNKTKTKIIILKKISIKIKIHM